jgi:coenzyme F420-0:L-glutamate ligase / coenzyme F420-1:gamma-L-glutamate ligase
VITDNTSLLELIQARRSIRRYSSQPIPRDWIDQMLNAAIWAPSAHNRQPWRFVVIEQADTKVQLATSMGARLQHDLSADHVPQAIIDKDVSRSYDRITSAPIIIVVCMTVADMDVYSDDKRNHYESVMAIQSSAMAGQNLLLMAQELGLGACWMCAPLFCPDVVQSALDLPEDWQAQGMITLGFPAQTREKTRKPLESSILWR